jgi:hypothetical protein
MLPYRLQVLFETLNLALDDAAVAFKLCLAGASGTDTTAESFQVAPLPRQTREQVLVLRQLHLELALAGPGPFREYIQNQGDAVDNLYLEEFL